MCIYIYIHPIYIYIYISGYIYIYINRMDIYIYIYRIYVQDIYVYKYINIYICIDISIYIYIYISWEISRRGGKRWVLVRGETAWEQLRRVVRRLEKNCDGLRRAPKSWEVVATVEKEWCKMRRNSQNRVSKMWGFTPTPIGKPCLSLL